MNKNYFEKIDFRGVRNTERGKFHIRNFVMPN